MVTPMMATRRGYKNLGNAYHMAIADTGCGFVGRKWCAAVGCGRLLGGRGRNVGNCLLVDCPPGMAGEVAGMTHVQILTATPGDVQVYHAPTLPAGMTAIFVGNRVVYVQSDHVQVLHIDDVQRWGQELENARTLQKLVKS